ncbi:MAG TPA: hypothetical protein VK147_03985 [Candidatus Didemnitutus sp.]|nr:hypothetical protein [Candidatus Didemnitutus sp.]
MIPDILVSKYLDGDLSIEEDMELRKRISEDPAAKEAFDAAILIHIAMSCADPIEVPEDTREDTLAAVFARIDSAAAAPLPRTGGGGGNIRMQRLMASLVVGLFALTVPVQDVVMQFFDRAAQAQVALVDQETGEMQVTKTTGRRTQSQIHVRQDQPTAIISDLGAPSPSVFEQDAREDVKTEEPPTRPLASLFHDAPQVKNPRPDPARIGIDEPPSPTLAVVLGTYVGTGFGGSEPTMSNATIFSQSVGFGVGDGLVVGLEFGSLSYASNVVTTANIRRNEPGAGWAGRVPGESGRPSKLDPTSNNGYDLETITTTATTSRLWGSAFVQKSVIRSGFAEVLVRGGMGVDNIGLVGYGRVTGQVHLQQWISLSVGAEARTVQGILLNAIVGLQITP